MIQLTIENASGVRQGPGPITSATLWRHKRLLNRAGSFSFTMPASDPRRSLVQAYRHVRCWQADALGVQEVGAGRIMQMRTAIGPDNLPLLVVDGINLLGELADRMVRRAEIQEEVTDHPAEHSGWAGAEFLNVIDGAVGDTLTSGEIAAGALGVGVGHWARFHKWNFVLGEHANTENANTRYQYSKAGPDVWGDLGIWLVSDTTRVGDKPMAQSGTITWIFPPDWERPDGSIMYKMRQTDGSLSTHIDVSDTSIVFWQPTNDALAQIMAYAPAGWALDAANGYTVLQQRPLSGVELIATNASFELFLGTIDDATPDIFDDWTGMGYSSSKVLAVSLRHSGAASVKLLTGVTGGGLDYAYVQRDLVVAENTEYTFSFWHTDSGNSPGQYRIYDQSHSIDSYGNGAHITNLVDLPLVGATWTQTPRVFTTPAGCFLVRVRFYSPFGANDWVCYDDVSLQAGGNNAVYLMTADESVLEMLIRVAEVTAENFRQGDVGRQVLWLGKDERASGLRAIGASSMVSYTPAVLENDAVLLILDAEEIEDAADLVSRVYAYGAGAGTARLTLEHVTTQPPAGYVLGGDAVNGWYVERTAAVAAMGIIEKAEQWPDILPGSDAPESPQQAANMLLIQAVHYLEQHSCTDTDPDTGDVPKFYHLAVVKAARPVREGTTILVRYEQWRDGVRAFQINRQMWITAVEYEVGENGVLVAGLDVATVARQPLTNDELALRNMKALRGLQQHVVAVGS